MTRFLDKPYQIIRASIEFPASNNAIMFLLRSFFHGPVLYRIVADSFLCRT